MGLIRDAKTSKRHRELTWNNFELIEIAKLGLETVWFELEIESWLLVNGIQINLAVTFDFGIRTCV